MRCCRLTCYKCSAITNKCVRKFPREIQSKKYKEVRETLINGPTSEVAGEMASNFLDDEANRRSIQ
nr:MAG TPA: hypothetical protein [Caudoviricetes sp.]